MAPWNDLDKQACDTGEYKMEMMEVEDRARILTNGPCAWGLFVVHAYF